MFKQRKLGDDDDDDAHRILGDGEVLRVPPHMMDSMQREVARHGLSTRLHDGRGGPVGHKPGHVFSSDASLNEAKERAYAAYDAELRDAYKHPQRCRGDIDASDVAHDALAVLDERERAYREHDEADANAWRGPRDSGKW